MTNRPIESYLKDCCSNSELRLNQQIKCPKRQSDEGCPVIDESGTVCGETDSLNIFQEFRKIYEDILKRLERSPDGNELLSRMAPFKKIVDDLWEQNTLLVEAVEELEQEATCQMTDLQNKLDRSCQKELHCIVKAKEREVQCLNKELSEKNDLLAKNRCHIEELENEIKAKRQLCQDLVKRLKCASGRKEGSKCLKKDAVPNCCSSKEEREDEDKYYNCDAAVLTILLNEYLADLERQRNSWAEEFQIVERQRQLALSERMKAIVDRNDMNNKLQAAMGENEKLTREIIQKKAESNAEKEELKKAVEELTAEKAELICKITGLHETIKDLNVNFKETRWALTTEVAEKHDQVQEMRRRVAALEEQLMQTDKQIQFKDDVVKELRRELKILKRSGHQSLFDVAEELRRQKSWRSDHASTATFTYDTEKAPIMSCPSPCQDGGPDSGFFSSTAPVSPEKKERNEESSCENARLRSQLECVKNSLKLRMKELRIQQELTRDLEEELERTKLDLASLQEKCDKKERRQKSSTVNSMSDPGLSWKYGTLFCAVSKVEETLRNLSEKHICGLSECKTVIQKEIENIQSVKNDLKVLEANKSKNRLSDCGSKHTFLIEPCETVKSLPSIPTEVEKSACNLIHLTDVEYFREKALAGAATLEEMRGQIDVLQSTVRKYLEEFPCECDKGTWNTCEIKLDTLREEFDEFTDQLCSIIRKMESCECNAEIKFNESSTSICSPTRENRCVNTEESLTEEDFITLKLNTQKLQGEICNQENEIEKLRKLVRQVECDLEEKRNELCQQNRNIESRMCEIEHIRDLMEEITWELETDSEGERPSSKVAVSQGGHVTNLKSLFSSMREFRCVLEKFKEILMEAPKIQKENEKLRSKILCLDKYICNKEETVKILQDTVKLKECQIEEIKLKMESSANEASKLTQDVEEKCRLIANLQEAVRKCKQFEVGVKSEKIEALKFKICDLSYRLKKSEKEVFAKGKKLDVLIHHILVLSSKNISLKRELNRAEPRVKLMFKKCCLYEKMVNDLQAELSVRECEVDGLCGKIKELEDELEREFKKCENRASEDSKCIEDLSAAVKEFQKELCLARENYNLTIAETEEKLEREREAFQQKECELKERICQLKSEIMDLKVQLDSKKPANETASRISDLESMVKEAECRQVMCDKRIVELENILECTVLEHEEERKNILEKLCEEKKENVKNKALITKLNENIKRKLASEKSLRECMERVTEDAEILRTENEELKTEVEVRKKMMSAMERNESVNLVDLEEMICRLKMQKADVKSRCCNLRAELDRELKLKRLLECRVEDLNAMLENKLQEFDEMVKNYKCTSSKLQQTLIKVKQAEDASVSMENNLMMDLNKGTLDESECLKKIIDVKTAENAKLFSRLLVTKVEMETLHTEYFAAQANKDCLISRLRYEASCLEKNYEDLREKYEKSEEENKRVREELDCFMDKTASMQAEFREKQREMCAKLRSALCEKNDLLNSVDKLQKQLEHICLENVNKEEINRELAEECSRLKTNNDANDTYIRNKSDKIICNLSKEVKNLQCELCALKESYDGLNDEYQSLKEQHKCLEKKKANLEKLYHEINLENGQMQELKLKMEKELCELRNHNLLLKEKVMALSSAAANNAPTEDIQSMYNKVKELTTKVKTLEKRIIPDLEQEIVEKNCCIESMNDELRAANISSQRMRNEALRVIQHTKKYLAAQRCANETLKSRLKCSNKRGNLLGEENRELEEQLKAVTRMNEFLLCQLENSKSDVEVEPSSCSPLPWSCATVERDTSSSEYLNESGIQSLQQSPTNLDCAIYDCKQDPNRMSSSQWSGLKRNKHGGSAEYSACHGNVR